MRGAQGTFARGFPAAMLLVFLACTPAAVRALALKEKHSFKAEMDEAARLAMFPHLAQKVA